MSSSSSNIKDLEKWLQDYLNETIKKKGFRVSRFPKDDEESDTEIKDPDRIHKCITVVFEVDNKENLDLYLNEETPKIQKALQDKFNSKNASVVSSCRSDIIGPDFCKLIEKVTLGRLISTVFPKIKSLKPKYNFDWIKDLQPINPQIFAEIDVVDFTYNLPYFTRLLFDHSKDKFKKIKSMTIDDFVMDVENIDVEFQQFFPVYHPVYVFTEASSTDKSYQVVDAYNCQLIDPSVSNFDSIKYSLGFGLPDRFLFGAYFLNMLDKIDDNFNDIVTNAENHYMLPINWDLGIIQPFRERFEANQQFLEIVEKYYGLLSELKALYYNNGSYKPSYCRNFDDWISYINMTNGWKEIYKKLKIPSDLPSLSVFSQYFYTVKSGFFQSVNASGIKEKLHKFDHKFSLKNKFPGSTSTPYLGVNLGRVNLDGVNPE
ncbi:9916_t:CDS:2 [Entrophospora sp. SA101]|nr:9916_t:CDS:2 [Entrophospora sp. SA101]